MNENIKSYTHVALVLDASGSHICCCDVRPMARMARSIKNRIKKGV